MNQTCVIVMLVQARPGYWHQAAAATLPRNCLLDLVKLCCSDTGDAEGDTVQRTVLRFTVTSPARAEPAEEVVLETVDWIRWREVFSLWMVATTAVAKFSPEVRRVAGLGDGVTCAEMSGGHVITELTRVRGAARVGSHHWGLRGGGGRARGPRHVSGARGSAAPGAVPDLGAAAPPARVR